MVLVQLRFSRDSLELLHLVLAASNEIDAARAESS